MAEITYNDLLSQLSGMEKDQFEGVLGSSGFLGNYQKNPDSPLVTGHSNYEKFKPIAEAYQASETIPKGNFISNMFNFSSADAAIPDNQYGIGSIDMGAYYTPDQQALMFGNPNYFGNQQFYAGSNVPVATPFRDSMNEPMDIENFLGTSTPENLGFIDNAPQIKEAIYQDRIMNRNLPGFAYEPKESLINRIGSQLGNVKTTLGDAWGKTKELGTRFKEGAAPVLGLASMIGNAVNPINPKAFNYNPELAGQLNFINEQFPGMIVNNSTSGLLQYAPGTPLGGQGVMSIAGSNDPIAQLEKQMAKHQKTIDKLPDMWSKLKGQNIDPETGLDDLGRKIKIHQQRLKDAETLRDKILADKKARIAERAQAERDFVTQGLGVTAADAATSGRGMDHTRGMTSTERGKAASRMGGGSRQAKSGSQKAGGSGRTDKGWGWARGGRVGYANGGLASLFTRRG